MNVDKVGGNTNWKIGCFKKQSCADEKPTLPRYICLNLDKCYKNEESGNIFKLMTKLILNWNHHQQAIKEVPRNKNHDFLLHNLIRTRI